MPINVCQNCGNEFVAPTWRRKSCYGQAPALQALGLNCNPRMRFSAARRYAIVATSAAIRQRRLIPQPCEVCLTDRHVVAHHDDYAMPLDVRWLCRSHHDAHHRQFGPGANA